MISYLTMSTGMECANCKKGIMHGHNMSHAKNRTNRIFEPNLHPARIMVNGAMKRVRLCTKCLRKAKKAAVKIAPKPATVATA
jgi:large subunit ribosomal protein L28